MGKWIYIPDEEEESESLMSSVYDRPLEEIDDTQSMPDEYSEWDEVSDDEDWYVSRGIDIP